MSEKQNIYEEIDEAIKKAPEEEKINIFILVFLMYIVKLWVLVSGK